VTPTQACPVDSWHDAVDLAGLHACRTVAELDRQLLCKLVRILPDRDLALCTSLDGSGRHQAQLVHGAGCPFQAGADVEPDTWQVPPGCDFQVRYRNHRLGTLLVSSAPDPEYERLLTAMLAHYGVALVNLMLGEEGRKASDHYCASLQALEEGIVLFQESDPEVIAARLIGLATAIVQATAGALFALDQIGDPGSELRLVQTLGIPDSLLQGFRGADGSPWPRSLLGRPAFCAFRNQDPTLGGLDPAALPEILTNLTAMPLRYHGVVAGICVLFNAAIPAAQVADHVDRLDNLGQLGAALLHRLSLEAASVRSRTIQTQLSIAATIQRRLLPRQAPAIPGFEFAWRSQAAQSIGGDYLDLVKTQGGEVCALIADASGHGIDSALLMSSFRANYRAGAPAASPDRLLTALNNEVHDEVGTTGMFITAATLRIAPGTRRMTIASAGHNPVLLFRATDGSIEHIDSHGPPLGFLAGIDYGCEERVLGHGDVLLLYTDGITEAVGRRGDMFGMERLERSLRQHAGGSSREIVDGILADLTSFSGQSHQEDDVSLSVVKVG
jgi:serine phosphatase RsbU (regulator of sigma subunit)